MKNHNEMYQNLLSRYNEYEERKKKRIRTIRRTVPVLACFCFVVVFGLGYWEDLEKLPNVPISPNIVEDQTIDNTGTTSPTDVADTTENSQAAQGKQTDPASTTIASTQTETNGTSATGSDPTVTTAVSVDNGEQNNGQDTMENRETQATVGTLPVFETKPNINIQTTMPDQTTPETPVSTVTQTEPIPIETTTEPKNHVISTAQPITFESVEATVNAILIADVSSYSELDQNAYYDMFETIQNDGAVYLVDCNDALLLRDDLSITLYPYAEYGDIGIGYYVSFNDELYQINFYYADCNIIREHADITEYLRNRIGRRSDKIIHIDGQYYNWVEAANGKIYASSFIDQTHYFDVISSAPESEMIEFLKILSFKQINIYN